MTEIDLRGNKWLHGYPREEQLISREIYTLLLIFGGSETLVGRRRSEEGDVYGWSIRYFEYAEISRILVNIAAMLRNDWDASPGRAEMNLNMGEKSHVVGTLVANLKKASATTELFLRDSFNKILHAYTINLERSEGPSFTSGYLLPKVHLYGKLKNTEWKASIDIYAWAEAVHAIS